MEQFVDENNYPLFDGVLNLKQERMSQTAMQEFFMVLKEFNKELYNTMYNEGILDTALEKEKEEIVESFSIGYVVGTGEATGYFTFDDMKRNIEEYKSGLISKHTDADVYYNQKYNQNK